jgi:hypothetical protein
MGQHDPLDGLVTYSELQAAATNVFKESALPDLRSEIADTAEICRGLGTNLATDDPLGIGGLLFDASRIVQLVTIGGFDCESLLNAVVNSALCGIDAFAGGDMMAYPAEYRLAFRELGLSIGLSGIENMQKGIAENPDIFLRESLGRQVDALMEYAPLKKTIEQFWMAGKSRETGTWAEHREINMVMLATSLAPDEFLMI